MYACIYRRYHRKGIPDSSVGAPAWHCGGSANNTHIGVEICEPSCLHYTMGCSFSCSDKEAAMEVVNRTYAAAVELFAFLCTRYALDPLADGVILSHREGAARSIASNHGDPEHLWSGIQSGFTMDGFRKDVSNAMGKAPEQPKTRKTVMFTQKLEISERGVALVAKYEGCRLEAYKCPEGVWTIGYGHSGGVNPGDRLNSREEAMALLKEDLKRYAGYVNACARDGLITFPLTQNQFDALTSFCYSCGRGSLKSLVEDRSPETIADKLLLYCKGGGRELPGLVRRRKEERELFMSES